MMKPNGQAAIDFLQRFRPEGPWTLTGIVPDGRISTTTFRADQVDMARDWIEVNNASQNIYFQVNSGGDANLTKKAKKEHIRSCEWLHVDVDPTTDDPELFEADRKRILAKIEDYSPAPNLIIDSGGGYQAFWKLDVKIESKDAKDWPEVELRNRQISNDFDGDNCHNIDRIMRLPGTLNHPNKKKVSKGRKVTQAKLVRFEDRVFALDVFPEAPMVGGDVKGDAARVSINLSGNLKPVVMEDLDEWDVGDDVKAIIVQGNDPVREDRWSSRSEMTWFVVCELVRCKVDDDIIASIFLDSTLPVSGHVLDQGNPESYIVRQLQRAHENAIDPHLREMNDKHFFTIIGGKARVGTQSKDEITFMEKATLDQAYANRKVQIGTDKDENPIYAPLAKWWFEHQQRRQYLDGVCFEPEGEVGPTRLNLWRGFTVAPKPGSGHQAWLGHVRDVICSGNVDHYNYLIRWCARLFQHPATQSEVAIVLKGREGTGKNTFVNAMAVLLGRHFFESADSSTFLGQFTAHLRDKVLVHANEAFYAGNKQHDGALKTLITEALVKIEAKGVDLTREPNYMHLIMSSNSEWVVPAGADARRYFVLDVADVRMQDTDYFAQVNALLHDRTAQANLLHFLLSMDLTDFNVRKMPVTSALLDQKAKSMASEFAWWNQCLTYGAVVSGDADWPSRVQCERVRDEYHRYCDGMKVNYGRKDMVELGKFLSKMGVSREQHRHEGGRASFYIFRPMEDHRDIFDKKAGGPFEWPKVEEKGQVEIPI